MGFGFSNGPGSEIRVLRRCSVEVEVFTCDMDLRVKLLGFCLGGRFRTWSLQDPFHSLIVLAGPKHSMGLVLLTCIGSFFWPYMDCLGVSWHIMHAAYYSYDEIKQPPDRGCKTILGTGVLMNQQSMVV